jgi:general stress protein YciG
MSAGIGSQHQTPTNEKNPQMEGSHEAASSSEQQKHEQPQELQADKPPRADVTEGEHKPRRPRGFAAMDRKLVSEIARKGGKAAHSAGTAHEFTTEEARIAGRKGGRATHAKRRAAQEHPSEPSKQGE